MNRRDWNRAVDKAVDAACEALEAGQSREQASRAALAACGDEYAAAEAMHVVTSSRFWQ